MAKMITVMGAGGNTGAKIARALLSAGEKVRALGRTRGKLAELERAGAEVRAGEFTDVGFLTNAFRGSEAIYTLLPTDRRSPDYRAQQDREGETIVTAARDSGVRYVVALSSLGANSLEATGVIRGLGAQEERLRRLEGRNIFLLRPVSFFENFYDQLEVIKHQGIIADSVKPELPIPMIAARDVADVAVSALRARDWRGVVIRELIGQRNLSYVEAARIIGERIGRPDLAYVRLSYPDMANTLVQAGFSASFAELYVQMTRAFNDGTVDPPRTPETTTPTPFEAFADELAEAYRAM